MSDCMVYWKEYWYDPEQPLDDNWYAKQKSILKQIGRGDRLWVVTSGGPAYPKEWRLLQKMEIENTRYERKYDKIDHRPYHLIGYLNKGRQYDIDSQSDLAPILHRLEFLSGKRLKFKGSRIGLSLQTIRPLSTRDGKLLESYSRKLKKRKKS